MSGVARYRAASQSRRYTRTQAQTSDQLRLLVALGIAACSGALWLLTDAASRARAGAGALALIAVAALALALWSPWSVATHRVLDANALRQLTPVAFERHVADLFSRAGYQVRRVGASGDGGVDVRVWHHGRRGIVQCKRYRLDRTVGPATIRELVGARSHEAAHIACLATTGRITEGARRLADDEHVIVLDTHDLVAWEARLRRGRRGIPGQLVS